ncbi:MAG TPA: hypothetical protein PLJ35_02170 [Anaerolineae bacterium]|nr:hypothetical protein [Anaerolineae bacterium]HOQ97610.1 hypothetical protein [Anaerolineae bacterium]HPL27381.1 hypothetical protein [Anaerolineae bacterium]
MKSATRGLEDLACWGTAASAVAYTLLHLLLVVALVTFGRIARGYPLQALAIAVYGVLAVAGTGVAVWLGRRGGDAAQHLLPGLALAVFLAVALAGAFYATPILGGLGLRTEYAPYLDDDGLFAIANVALATWVVALALVARWRGLLVAGMAAQGLALLLNPGLIAAAVRHGLPPDAHGLLALPLLYLVAGVALGRRLRPSHLAWAAGLFAAGALLSAGLLLGASGPRALPALLSGRASVGATVPRQILATGAFFPFVLGLAAFAWRLRRWAGLDAAGGAAAGSGHALGLAPGAWAVAGVGMALLALVAGASWVYLGPAHGLGDGWLPEAGRTLGWIGKTVPQGAYGVAGEALAALKGAFPWLVGAAALAWLAAAGVKAARLGPHGALRAIGFPGGLALLGLAMLWQCPLLPFPFLYPQPPLVHGLAAALPHAVGQDWLGLWLWLGYALLGLALVGLSAPLSDDATQKRGGLTFCATLLASLAALALTAGLWAGATQGLLEAQRLAGLPALRQAAQLRLALSLPANALLAAIGWATAVAGWRALTRRGGPLALPGAALRRGLVLAAALAVAGGLAFWQWTAMPIATTSPANGAVDVPTNAPIVVRLRPGPRHWGPGLSASYAGTGEHIPGTSGGTGTGETYFAPDGGWRPHARVNVQVLGGMGLRSYTFSFTTAGGPAPDVTPLPGPRPRAPSASPGS